MEFVHTPKELLCRRQEIRREYIGKGKEEDFPLWFGNNTGASLAKVPELGTLARECYDRQMNIMCVMEGKDRCPSCGAFDSTLIEKTDELIVVHCRNCFLPYSRSLKWIKENHKEPEEGGVSENTENN